MSVSFPTERQVAMGPEQPVYRRLRSAAVAGSMALVMLFLMLHMYKDKRANLALAIGSVALIGLGPWPLRIQATVGDIAWMKAMSPHHSNAIRTSERAHVSDSRVGELADAIY